MWVNSEIETGGCWQGQEVPWPRELGFIGLCWMLKGDTTQVEARLSPPRAEGRGDHSQWEQMQMRSQVASGRVLAKELGRNLSLGFSNKVKQSCDWLSFQTHEQGSIVPTGKDCQKEAVESGSQSSGPQNSSNSIPRELVRNASSQAAPQNHGIRSPGAGVQPCESQQEFQATLVLPKREKHCRAGGGVFSAQAWGQSSASTPMQASLQSKITRHSLPIHLPGLNGGLPIGLPPSTPGFHGFPSLTPDLRSPVKMPSSLGMWQNLVALFSK